MRWSRPTGRRTSAAGGSAWSGRPGWSRTCWRSPGWPGCSSRGTAAAMADDSMSYALISDLAALRAFVAARAVALGLEPSRADLLTLAVNELATNTLQYTREGGQVRLWSEDGQLVCDVV